MAEGPVRGYDRNNRLASLCFAELSKLAEQINAALGVSEPGRFWLSLMTKDAVERRKVMINVESAEIMLVEFDRKYRFLEQVVEGEEEAAVQEAEDLIVRYFRGDGVLEDRRFLKVFKSKILVIEGPGQSLYELVVKAENGSWPIVSVRGTSD